jgi:hypothetical protein
MADKDENTMPIEECKTRAREKGSGESGAQRCDQSGSTGTVKPAEVKSMKEQQKMVKNTFGMDDNNDEFGEERS